MPEFVFNVVVNCDTQDQANWVMEDLYDPDWPDHHGFEYTVEVKPIPVEYPVNDDAPRVERDDLCAVCKQAEHDVCSMSPSCPCCRSTIAALGEQMRAWEGAKPVSSVEPHPSKYPVDPTVEAERPDFWPDLTDEEVDEKTARFNERMKELRQVRELQQRLDKPVWGET